MDTQYVVLMIEGVDVAITGETASVIASIVAKRIVEKLTKMETITIKRWPGSELDMIKILTSSDKTKSPAVAKEIYRIVREL